MRARRQTGTIVFYAIYFVLLAAALSAAVIGLGELWKLLQRYEECQMYHVTDAVAAELDSGRLDMLYQAADRNISPYETEDMLHEQLRQRFSGEFSFRKNAKESRKERPVYTLRCGDEPVCLMSLKQTGTDPDYGFEIYGVDRLYGLTPEMNESVTFTIPTGCSVKINGIPLFSGDAHTAEPVAEAENFGGYLECFPELLTYTIDGLMFPPQLEFADSSGAPIAAEQDENGAYACPFPVGDKETAEQAAQFALEFSELYSRYIANDAYFSSLSGLIPEHTKLYRDLSTYEGQFYTYHTGYEFTGEKILRTTRYSDSCFAVRVSYTHNVFYGGETFSYPADNTVFMVRTDNGWKAVGLTMN